jgi:MHS family proline/betaine transporter-like MFS transporter
MKILAISVQESLKYSVLSLFALCFFVPTAGWLSEKISYEKMFKYGCICSILSGYPIFYLMTSGSVIILILSQFLMGGIISFIAAPLFALLISRFPTNIRYTGVSFVFNTAMALFGSTAPVIGFTIMQFGDIASPGLYWSLSAVVGLLTLKNIKIPTHHTLAASFN